MIAPLGWLSLGAARQVWFLASELALLAAAASVWRRAGGDGPALLGVGAVWCFGGTVTANLGLGQLTPLLLLLLALSLVLLERRHSHRAGRVRRYLAEVRKDAREKQETQEQSAKTT